jgi:hypothetical protein
MPSVTRESISKIMSQNNFLNKNNYMNPIVAQLDKSLLLPNKGNNSKVLIAKKY